MGRQTPIAAASLRNKPPNPQLKLKILLAHDIKPLHDVPTTSAQTRKTCKATERKGL